MTSQEYVDLIKSAALTLAKDQVMKYLASIIPRLISFPITGLFIGWAVQTIVTILIKYTEFAAFFWYTDFRTDQQGRDFIEAAIQNRNAQLNGSADDKAKSKANLISKFKPLAKFNQ